MDVDGSCSGMADEQDTVSARFHSTRSGAADSALQSVSSPSLLDSGDISPVYGVSQVVLT